MASDPASNYLLLYVAEGRKVDGDGPEDPDACTANVMGTCV